MVSGVIALMILMQYITNDTKFGISMIPFETILIGVVLGKILLVVVILFIIADHMEIDN